MPTRAALASKAADLGIEVDDADTKKDIEAMIADAEAVEESAEEEVVEESPETETSPEAPSSSETCVNCSAAAEWETTSRTTSRIAVCTRHRDALAEPTQRI